MLVVCRRVMRDGLRYKNALIPAQAGIYGFVLALLWIPAYAGMTSKGWRGGSENAQFHAPRLCLCQRGAGFRRERRALVRLLLREVQSSPALHGGACVQACVLPCVCGLLLHKAYGAPVAVFIEVEGYALGDVFVFVGAGYESHVDILASRSGYFFCGNGGS